MITVYKKFLLTLGVTVLLCISASVVWSETIDNLVQRDGLYYKKFTDVPFTGKVDGQFNGSIKNGKRYGFWRNYFRNGQLNSKGKYKNGKKDGLWIFYWDNGKLNHKGKYKNGLREGYWVDYNQYGTQIHTTGVYKNDKKISN